MLIKKKFDITYFEDQFNYLVENEVFVPIPVAEIESDKHYLQKIAKEWGSDCLIENHTDRLLYRIAAETRDKAVVGKELIKEFVVSGSNENGFKALLKSFHCYNESNIIIAKLKEDNESTMFNFNHYMIEFNVVSLFHILFRHFAQSVSPESLMFSKSYFTPDIPPEIINQFLNKVFKEISKNKLFEGIEVNSDYTIYLRYRGIYYALAFGPSKDNKGIIIIKSFFPIEQDHNEGKEMLDRVFNTGIMSSNFVGDGLTIYTPKS